jgi:hypothetical protein
MSDARTAGNSTLIQQHDSGRRKKKNHHKLFINAVHNKACEHQRLFCRTTTPYCPSQAIQKPVKFFSQNKEKLVRDGEKKRLEKVGMGTGVKKISPLLSTCEDGLTGLTDANAFVPWAVWLDNGFTDFAILSAPLPFLPPLPLFHFEKLAWIGWVSVNVPAGLFGGCETRVAVHWIGSAREIW